MRDEYWRRLDLALLVVGFTASLYFAVGLFMAMRHMPAWAWWASVVMVCALVLRWIIPRARRL